MAISFREELNAALGHDVMLSGAVICHVKNRRFGRTVEEHDKHYCPHCSARVYSVA